MKTTPKKERPQISMLGGERKQKLSRVDRKMPGARPNRGFALLPQADRA
jgi:hypothetical protein